MKAPPSRILSGYLLWGAVDFTDFASRAITGVALFLISARLLFDGFVTWWNSKTFSGPVAFVCKALN
jgi:hypothetical protein